MMSASIQGRIRKYSLCTCLAILPLPLLLLVFSSYSLAGQFKVIRVYDGDTVKAKGYDIEIKVRLVGIDAPEISHGKRKPGQPYGQRSKKYLTELVLNKIVDVKGYGLDRYGRVLGVILVDGKNVNLELVKEGLAEVYRGRPPHGFNTRPYLKAEEEAKRENRGMWAQGGRYVSPKDWRKVH